MLTRPRISALVALSLVGSPAAHAQRPTPVDSLPLHLFAYDRAAPIALRDSLRTTEGDSVAVYAVSFASPRGGRATRVMCVPAGSGPFAGILLQHGMPGNAEQTLAAARSLARHGAVVLYDAKADTANAARRYREFVNLWERADPKLQPKVAEVWRKLSRLTGVEQR